MIPNQWYPILESHEVRPGKVVGVKRLGQRLALWRDGSGRIVCVADQCPHRGAAFSIGRVIDGSVECPFHGMQFDGTGRCTLVPANGRNTAPPKALQARAYSTAEQHDFIWIWWGEPRRNLPPLPYFEDLESGFSYVTDRASWPVHYSRAVENQLDVFHLPFVHATTIGRGKRTVADGPFTSLENDELDIWVMNRVDDGVSARRKSELVHPNRPPSLRFRFPNLWMNRISDDFRIVVAFTPVDDENTLFYLRYYQRFNRLPGVRWLINQAIKYSSRVILEQDRRVVVTQQPVKTELRMGEKLIPADGPVISYRSRRQELIDLVALTGGVFPAPTAPASYPTPSGNLPERHPSAPPGDME